MTKLFLTVIFLFSISKLASSQDTTYNKFIYSHGKTCVLILQSGIVLNGKIFQEDSSSLIFRIDKYSQQKIFKTAIIFIAGPNFDLECKDELLNADKKHLKKIELSDGSELHGYIENIEPTSLFFKTESGVQMTIPSDQLNGIESLDQVTVEGRKYFEDPTRARLFFAPTAIPLKSGKGYFSVNELIFPVVGIGATDFLTLAGGISIFPFSTNQLYYLTVKVTPLQTKNFDLAGGILYSNLIGNSVHFKGLGIGYIGGTVFGPEASFTSGIGFGYTGGSFSSNPVIMAGGDIRISKSVKIVSENWIPTTSESVIICSLGLRFFGEHVSGDFALIKQFFPNSNDWSPGGWPFFPWVGFTYNF